MGTYQEGHDDAQHRVHAVGDSLHKNDKRVLLYPEALVLLLQIPQLDAHLHTVTTDNLVKRFR